MSEVSGSAVVECLVRDSACHLQQRARCSDRSCGLTRRVVG